MEFGFQDTPSMSQSIPANEHENSGEVNIVINSLNIKQTYSLMSPLTSFIISLRVV